MPREIIAYSLDGCLRLVRTSAASGVVELRSHLYPGYWRWCVRRKFTFPEAEALFEGQCFHHVDPHQYFQPVVRPGE